MAASGLSPRQSDRSLRRVLSDGSLERARSLGQALNRGGQTRFERRDGKYLHGAVPPSRWCITRSDLADFRSDVSIAIERGSIVPSDDDNFDPEDDRTGPKMSTVNRQLIVPVSAASGHASWALLLHPDGLDCDLFVTHCWREGAFEFLDKVLNSWPHGAAHCYCCMLSNPQTLDIDGLLANPRNSPFAQALQSAQCVLVVPNKDVSIYTRIWCVYEAYLAYSWHKPIFTATRPVRGTRSAAFAVWVRYVVCSAIGYYVLLLGLDYNGVHLVIIMPLMILSLFCKKPLVRILINEAGIISCALIYGQGARTAVDAHQKKTFAHCFVNSFFLCMFFACREADRVWSKHAEVEAAELRMGFTGRLQDAASSVERDRDTILRTISDEGLERDVEHTIQILIEAGMSTPSLRSAAAAVVDVSGASSWSLGMLMCTILAYVVAPVLHIFCAPPCGESTRLADVLAGIVSVQGLAWLLGFARLGPDQRGFAASVGMLIGFIPHCILLAALTATGVGCPTRVSDAIGALSMMPILLLSLWFGVAGFSAIPWIGPALVRSLMRPLRNDRAAHWRKPRSSSCSLLPHGNGISASESSATSSDTSSEAPGGEDSDAVESS